MKILIVSGGANDIVDLREYDHFVLEGVTSYSQIQTEMLRRQKDLNSYKYCVLEDEDFIPFYMKIKNKLANYMQEFTFERVQIKDLNLSDDKIKEIASNDINNKLLESYNHLIPCIVDIIEQLDIKTVDEGLISQIRALQSERDNFDKNKYLETFL